RERQALRDQVVEEVARSDAYAQTLAGPLLIVPFTRTLREQEPGRDGQLVTVTREVSGELRLLPATLDVDGALATEERQRGIYRARVYRADTRLQGAIDIPVDYGITEDAASYRFGTPHLALGISDIRGIGNALVLRADGMEVPFEPGTGTTLLASGVQAPLPALAGNALRRIDFEIALALTGTGDFRLAPLGRETQVRLTSDWPHPGFVGEFLPRERAIGSDGFTAQWQTSFFSTNMQELLARCQDGTPDACRDF